MRTSIRLGALLIASAALATGGCDEDRRVVDAATQAAERQAAQNVELARVAAHAAAGAHDLVAADAAARRAAVDLQQEIQAERGRLDAGWSALEAERRGIASQRRTASALAVAVRGLGIVVAALLALALAWLVLGGQSPPEPELGGVWEAVAAELAAPRRLAAPSAAPLPPPPDSSPSLLPPEESP